MSSVAAAGAPPAGGRRTGPNFQIIVPQLLKGAVVPFLGLRDHLRPVFNRDYTLSKLHQTLGRVARHEPLLIITTNYDDMIGRAFLTAHPEPLP